MSRAIEESNRTMLRARDAMDRTYAEPLDIAELSRVAGVSEAHFIRTFRATFGETPHRYLQRRRVERSTFLRRESARSVTDICLDVGLRAAPCEGRRVHAGGDRPRLRGRLRLARPVWQPDPHSAAEGLAGLMSPDVTAARRRPQ